MSEETQAPEGNVAAEAPAADEKTKKINKLSADKLKKKIEELESKKQTSSHYYAHLKLREAELNK